MQPALAQRLLILFAALLFSTGGAAIKATSMTGWQVASARSAIAALALFALLPAWRRFFTPRTLLVGAAYAATMVLFVSGNKLTTAANTIFLQSTAPIYLLLLGPWLLKERVRAGDFAFIATIALGMGLFFVGVEPPLRTAPDPLRGNLLSACSGFTWALTILGLRWLGREESPPGDDPAGAAVVAGNLLAALFCLPYAWPFDGGSGFDWLVLGYLGLFQIGLAYVCMTRGVRGVPALEASLLLLLEPVLNAVWAWLVHDERPGAWSLAGCSIILFATLFRTIRRSRAAEPHAAG